MGNGASSANGDAGASSSPALSFDIALEILPHLDVRDSARAATCCAALRDLQRSDLWWKLASERLGTEARLYVSANAKTGKPTNGGTWKDEFFRLWAARGVWREPTMDEAERARDRFRRVARGEDVSDDEDDENVDASARDDAADDRGSIKVCVRMKPKADDCLAAREGEDDGAKPVVLPLHQRLRVIKAKRGAACTTSDAMKVLMEEDGRGEESAASPWIEADVVVKTETETAALADVTNASASTRGAAGAEKKEEEKSSSTRARSVGGASELTVGVLSVDATEHKVLAVVKGVGLREFAFDAVFGDVATQEEMYETSSRSVVADFINGFNGTVVVYGQTGSGKTHTMFGPPPGVGGREHRGIVPRACEEVFDALRKREALGIRSKASVSYVEVYGQEVSNLLKQGAAVGQSRVARQRYVLDGRAEETVFSMSDVERLLEVGDAQKRRAATSMNERSSRAHSVFTLSLKQTDERTGRELKSRLCLADLGGSEKLSKSKANDGAMSIGTTPWSEYYDSRARLTEAVNINVGLLALKRCIDATHEAQRRRKEGKPPPHVPYQDSKLTTLLSSALGGDCKTVVFVTASGESQHAAETTQSLRFGEKCASVETRARVGANAHAKAIAKLNERIEKCEEEIKANERWETTRTIRKDERGGDDTEDEVVLTSKLVGAEDLRIDLEVMLRERDVLSGHLAAAETSAVGAKMNAAAEAFDEGATFGGAR